MPAFISFTRLITNSGLLTNEQMKKWSVLIISAFFYIHICLTGFQQYLHKMMLVEIDADYMLFSV